MCTCENNSCTWAGDLQLPIIGTNEPMMTTLYIRAFQIVLKGGQKFVGRGSTGGIFPGGGGPPPILPSRKTNIYIP